MLEVRVLKAGVESAGREERFTTLLRRSLTPSRVWVTNPVPVIQFHFLNSDRLRRQIQTPTQHHGLVLTSPRCVESIQRCIGESAELTAEWESSLMDEWKAKPTFCVGPGTASSILKLYGMAEEKLASHKNFIVSQAGNAEDLGKVILKESEKHPITLPLVYPCGRLATDTLSSALTKGSIPFEALTVYETVENPELGNILKSMDMDSESGGGGSAEREIVYVFFSPSGVKFSMPYLQDLRSKHFVAIGPTTRAALESVPSLAGQKIYECANPTPEALAEVVLEIAEKVLPEKT